MVGIPVETPSTNTAAFTAMRAALGVSPAVFSVVAGTEAALLDARARALAAGGGTIYLPDATITLTAPIPADSDIAWVGVTPRFALGVIPDNAWTYTGGTILRGDGTFPCFQANNTALGSPAVGSAYSDAHIKGFKISDVGFDNFTSAFAVGAVNNPGFLFSEFRRLWVKSCTSWVADFTNIMHSDVEYVFGCSSAHGIRFRSAVPQATLVPGNMTVRHVYMNQANVLGRGIVFEAITGAQFNEVRAERIQCNRFGGAGPTQAATMSNGSTSIGVTDGTKFAVGLPAVFDATANGFTVNQTYFVLSVSGNVLTVGSSRDGAAISATGNTAVNIKSNGFPSVEIVAAGPGGVTQSRFLQLDCEGYSSACLYIENVAASVIDMTENGGTTSFNHIVARRAQYNTITTYKEAILDFDGNCYTTQFHGFNDTIRQRRVFGIAFDKTQMRGGLNISGSSSGQGFDIADLSLSGGAVLQVNRALTLKSNASAGGVIALDAGRAGLLGCNFGGTNTWTLPTITNASAQTSLVGLPFYIPNISSSPLTLNTDGTQVFNGKAGKTSVIIPPGGAAWVAAHVGLGWAVFGDAMLDTISGSKSYDPSSIASGAQTSTTVTVTGAALGDEVEGVAASIDVGGLLVRGYVSAVDTVTVIYANLTGGAVDLASHSLYVRVRKR